MNTSAPPIGIDLAQRFLVRRDDTITGPFDLVELAASLRADELTPATEVRRERKTLWQPLATLPEFPLVQAMPIETIAFHLEQKANALKPRQVWVWYKSPPLLFFIFGAILFLAVLSLIYTGPPLPPPPKTPPPPWFTSTIDNVSIDCPAAFQRLPQKESPFVTGYWADVPYAHFGVELRFAHVPDRPAEVEKGFDQFELYFLVENRGKLVSESRFSIDGQQARDVLFTSTKYGTAMPGGLRMLAAKGQFAMAWTLAHTTEFGPYQINRFINSVHFQ